MSTTRRVFGFVLVLALSILTGCRTNLLPEYAGRITATQAQVRVATIGTVSVATGRDEKGKQSAADSLAKAAVGIAALSAAYNAERKLQEAMPPARVAKIVTAELSSRARSVGIPFIAEGAGANTQLIVEVRSYGIEAAGDLTPASARFHLYGYLTYLPEAKLIWEYTVFLDIPLSSVHVANVNSSIPGDISNVMAIANLERRDIRRLFSAATRIATQRFMSRLASDYEVGRVKWQAKYGPIPVIAPPPPAPPPDDDDSDEPPAQGVPPVPGDAPNSDEI
ncbi:MAG: hypothetical protein IPK82_31925 [Polyangiaceae bacterium]|nr:hypothetical protein [Polyangiaceae bacterium]